MSAFRDGFGTGSRPIRDGLLNSETAENSHFGTGGTGWDRFLPQQALHAHISGIGKMRPDPSQSVPADNCTPESEITADLSATDLTVTLPAIAAFWNDALIHDRAEMRARWAEYRGVVPDALAGAIVDGVEAARESIG